MACGVLAVIAQGFTRARNVLPCFTRGSERPLMVAADSPGPPWKRAGMENCPSHQNQGPPKIGFANNSKRRRISTAALAVPRPRMIGGVVLVVGFAGLAIIPIQ